MKTVLDFTAPWQTGAARLQHGFDEPEKVLQAYRPEDVPAVLEAVQQAAEQGLWCVGWLAYEAASGFDRAYAEAVHRNSTGQPLAWFGLHRAPLAACGENPPVPSAAIHWQTALSREQFDAHVARIHAAIAAGDCYQINYTAPLTAELSGEKESDTSALAQELFARLQQAQPGGYAALVDCGDMQVLSLSPELFFDWDGERILTRPMKGTAARGATPEQDAAQAQHLRTSVKERAENVMIVDLLRNDLGAIAQTGSVQVPALFEVQALPTVWQMTSDVRAQLPAGTSLLQVLQALFPCGSVTGAPKRAAMQAIAALEIAPRGWYCGALGVVRPDGAGGLRATFNVPIRTVVVQGAARRDLRCGIGSGITADATVAGEWQEWRTKRAFVERVSMDFEVITTLALEAGQFRHLPLHVQRLQQAAAHFGFPWHAQALELTLEHVAHTHPSGLWRVRIALQRSGLFSSQVVACPALPAVAYLQLAAEPLTQAHSEFVRFKTSRRAHYERFAPPPHLLDTVLWNEAGEITEGTRGNVAAWINGQWVTPALHCGLLNGVGRQVALAEGRLVEGVIRVADVPHIQQWAFINSLRGWVPAQMVAAPQGGDGEGG